MDDLKARTYTPLPHKTKDGYEMLIQIRDGAGAAEDKAELQQFADQNNLNYGTREVESLGGEIAVLRLKKIAF